MQFKKIIALFLFSINVCGQDNWIKKNSLIDLNKKTKASIVFAGSNLEDAPSMFGHIVLVLHNKIPFENDAITLEFTADTENVDFWPFKAVFSSLNGSFKLNHFLYKKRQYFAEGRNLTAYQLNFSEFTITELINQIKNSIAQNPHQYNFITTNCSYYLLNLLQKSIKEAETSPHPYTTPIEALKKLYSLFLPEQYIYKSSIGMAKNNFNKLTYDEKRSLTKILNNSNNFSENQNQSPNLRNALLSSSIFFMQQEEKLENRNKYFKIIKKISSSHFEYVNPEKKHSPIQKGDLLVGIGKLTNSDSFSLSFRPVMKDYWGLREDGLNSSTLKLAATQMSMLGKNILIDEINIFQIEQLKSSDLYSKGKTFLIDFSYQNFKRITHDDKKIFYQKFGLGKSFSYKDNSFSLLPHIEGTYSIHNYFLSVGSKFILFLNIDNWPRLKVEYQYYLQKNAFLFNQLKSNIVFFENNSLSAGLSHQIFFNEKKDKISEIKVNFKF